MGNWQFNKLSSLDEWLISDEELPAEPLLREAKVITVSSEEESSIWSRDDGEEDSARRRSIGGLDYLRAYGRQNDTTSKRAEREDSSSSSSCNVRPNLRLKTLVEDDDDVDVEDDPSEWGGAAGDKSREECSVQE